MTDRKSSSSTLNRLPEPEIDLDPVYRGRPSSRGRYRESPAPLDDKSVNISEFEASESGQGDYSFDARSVGSNEELDLPELNDDGSYAFSSQSRQSLNDSDEDFRNQSHARRFRKRQTYDVSSTSTDHSDVEDRGRRRRYRPTQEKTSRPVDVSLYNQDSAAYLLASYDDTAEATRREAEARERELEEAEHRDVVDDLQRVPEKEQTYGAKGRPQVYGDSLFTQEDGDVKYKPNQNSLVEFEQLEAAMSDGSDHVDLIGAYLQSLTDQDEYDDQDVGGQDFRDSLHYLDRGQRGADVREAESDSGPNEYDDQMSDNGDSHGASDEFVLVPQIQQQALSHDQESVPGSSDSIPFDTSQASISLITDQQPPFSDSLVMTSLDLTRSLQQGSVGNSHDLQLSRSRQNTPRQSKIPVSSRPGSTSPTRSRPVSRADSPNKSIPTCKKSPRSPSRSSQPPLSGRQPDSSPLSAASSHDDPYGQAFQMSDHHLAERESHEMSPDRDIDKAASMLLGDDDLDSELQEGLPPLTYETRNDGATFTTPSSPAKRSQSASAIHSSLPNKMSAGSRRAMTPQSFRVRGGVSPRSPLRSVLQPLKVTPESVEIKSSASFDGSEDLSQSSQSKLELKAKVVSELNARKQNEDTLNTLQKEYNSLLIKYAEVENMVDKLRTGAKVNLFSDAPTPGVAQPGKLPPAQHAQSFNIGRGSIAGTGTLAQIQQAVSLHGLYDFLDYSLSSAECYSFLTLYI